MTEMDWTRRSWTPSLCHPNPWDRCEPCWEPCVGRKPNYEDAAQPPHCPPSTHPQYTNPNTYKNANKLLCVMCVLRVPHRWLWIGSKTTSSKANMQDTQETRNVWFHLARTLPCPISGFGKKIRFSSQRNSWYHEHARRSGGSNRQVQSCCCA